MNVEYTIEAVVSAVAEDEPADDERVDERYCGDAVFAALCYHYSALGEYPVGDPHHEVELAVGEVLSSREVAVGVFRVCVRLTAAASRGVPMELVRGKVLEKLREALDNRADGQIDEITVTHVEIDRMVRARNGQRRTQ